MFDISTNLISYQIKKMNIFNFKNTRYDYFFNLEYKSLTNGSNNYLELKKG